tara:strand:- start:1581 stop:1862 length:282 start_codon:yes stop_codon:yes gene_type:complete
MSNKLEISGAYVTEFPKAKGIDMPNRTIVTRLARGTKADSLLLNCTMNNKSYTDYLAAWKESRAKQELEEPVTRSKYLAVRDEVFFVLEESFK